MKLLITASLLMKYGGAVAVAIGVLALWYMLTDSSFILARTWARYVAYLNKQLRFLFLPGSGKQIVTGQLAGVVAIVALELLLEIPYWYLFAALVVVGPALYLGSLRRRRIEQLELQIDGFMLALANGLKTVPSAGAALQAIAPVLRDPTRQEIDRVIKEMRVGSTLEQGLMNMSARLGSRPLDAALSAVLIGIQVGGNLSAVLETTASTIREMNRLEGSVKTKTSEGRAQLWVLALFPFVLCFMFNWAQPGYFQPLQDSMVGYIVTTVAALFWIASLVVAHRILAVDI